MKMRKIIHIDMDYFFAQVEERDEPSLKLRPVAIGGSREGRGVLCTSNYIARKFGVKSAMPVATALRLCPQLVLIKPTFQKYKEASDKVFEVCKKFTLKIQKVSIDEAYLDVTDCEWFNNDAIAIAKEIKRQIFQETKLTASAGVSYNKLLAKIGSDLFKPDGLAVLRPNNIEMNIRHFPISYINGVGKVTQKRMHEYQIYNFGDLQQYSRLDLINYFGDFGVRLFDYCRGIDEREVVVSSERKSLSVEKTFPTDIDKESELDFKLFSLFDELKKRLEKYENRIIKNIFLKLKYFDFSSTTIEAQSLVELSNYKDLFLKKFKEKNDPVRLMGVGVRFYSCQVKGQLELPLELL